MTDRAFDSKTMRRHMGAVIRRLMAEPRDVSVRYASPDMLSTHYAAVLRDRGEVTEADVLACRMLAQAQVGGKPADARAVLDLAALDPDPPTPGALDAMMPDMPDYDGMTL